MCSLFEFYYLRFPSVGCCFSDIYIKFHLVVFSSITPYVFGEWNNHDRLMKSYRKGQSKWKKSDTRCEYDDAIKHLVVMASDWNFTKRTGRH